MSISYCLIKVLPNVKSIDDIDENNLLEIGSRATVIDIIYETYPKVSFDEVYYYLSGCNGETQNNYYWQLFLGEDDPVKCLIVSPHVGICDLKIIENLCNRLMCRIFDPQHNQFEV